MIKIENKKYTSGFVVLNNNLAGIIKETCKQSVRTVSFFELEHPWKKNQNLTISPSEFRTYHSYSLIVEYIWQSQMHALLHLVGAIVVVPHVALAMFFLFVGTAASSKGPDGSF